jgi:hypothetical protein
MLTLAHKHGVTMKLRCHTVGQEIDLTIVVTKLSNR